MSQQTFYLFLNNSEYQNEAIRFSFKLNNLDLKENELKAIQLKIISELSQQNDIYYLGENQELHTEIKYIEEQAKKSLKSLGIDISELSIDSVSDLDELDEIQQLENPDIFILKGNEISNPEFAYLDLNGKKSLTIQEFLSKYNIQPHYYYFDQELLSSRRFNAIGDQLFPMLTFSNQPYHFPIEQFDIKSIENAIEFIFRREQTIENINDDLGFRIVEITPDLSVIIYHYFSPDDKNNTIDDFSLPAILDKIDFKYKNETVSFELDKYEYQATINEPKKNPEEPITIFVQPHIKSIFDKIINYSKKQQNDDVGKQVKQAKESAHKKTPNQ